MSVKCTGCGKPAVKSGMYWLICKDNLKVRNLIGAARVGLCEDCIVKYTKSSLTKPMLRALLWVLVAIAIAFFFFGGGYLHGSKLQTYALFAIMFAVAIFMAARVLVSVVEYKRNIRSKKFIETMSEEDFEYAAVKLLSYGKTIDKNIIFNCANLQERADQIIENGMSEKNRAYIKKPINVPKFTAFGIEKLHKDYVNIPIVGRPNFEKNPNVKVAIKIAAEEHYNKDENGKIIATE